MPRTPAIVIATIVAVVLAGGAFAAGAATSSGKDVAAPVSTATTEPANNPVPTSTPNPTRAEASPSPTPVKTGPVIGSPIVVGPVTFTVTSLESTQSIATLSGDPMTPVPGGQLVLFHTTYVNTQNPADLSCGGSDLYIQVFDERGREMAQIFDTYRIPGNQECNAQLLQGTVAEWNWAVQGVAGATPTTMVVTETIDWSSPVTISLTS